MTNDSLPLVRQRIFLDLLAMAIHSLDNRMPTIIEVADSPLFNIAFDWPRLRVELDELSYTVEQRILHGPVLLLPSWTRLSFDTPRIPGIPTTSVDQLALVHCRPANPTSVLAALVPANTLTGQAAGSVRAAIRAYWQPTSVIYANQVIPKVHPLLNVAAVVLKARESKWVPLRIIRLPEEGKEALAIRDFRQLLKMRSGHRSFGYVVGHELPPSESLAYDRHHPDIISQHAAMAEFGQLVRLQDLFDAPRIGIDYKSVLRSSPGDGRVRVIESRDIRRDGGVSLPDERTKWAVVPQESQVRPGDLLVRRFTSRMGRLAIAELCADDLPATVRTDNVIVLRPRKRLSQTELFFVKQFLQSPLANTLATDGVSMDVSRNRLLELSIPQPDNALSTALTDLNDAAGRFDQWRRDALRLLEDSLLENPKLARAKLLKAGRLLRMRAGAAAMLDNFAHTARTRFPHPISYRWRRVEAALSNGPTREALSEILEAAEVLLAYAANVAIVMARGSDIRLGAVDAIKDKLNSKRNGPSLGDWVAILREVKGRRFKQLPSDLPLGEIRWLLHSNDIDEACQRIVGRRNDLAHLRQGDLNIWVQESYADLTALMTAAEFLCDFRLLHITGVSWDSFRRKASIRYRALMGDHAIVPTHTMQYASNDVEEGSLYITDTVGGLHLLRPFLVGKSCPVCSQWSTFHIDRVHAAREVELKSLEHGHTYKDGEIWEPLQQVSWLTITNVEADSRDTDSLP
jgi:hypothetical protein